MTQKIINWDYRDRKSLDTFWISDVHLGSKHCDKHLFQQTINRILRKQMPFADLGDLLENATRDSVGAGVYEQEEITDQQIEEAVRIYTPVKHLLKSMHPGNHEARTFDKSAVNLTRIISKMLGVPYAGVGAVHDIRVGKQRYSVYTHHGGSCATTKGGKLNALLAMEKIIDADVYIQGHTHDTIFQSRDQYAFNPNNRCLELKKKYFINNGSYLNYWGSYGQVKGYMPGSKGSAQITFRGDKREIEVSFV
jgi:hypothetical protein